MFGADPPTLAFSTLAMLANKDEALTKEELLLRDQACRTLKESLRYHEEQYRKAMEPKEEEKGKVR